MFHAFLLELAMQNISNDKTVESNTVQGLNDFITQSLSRQVKKVRKENN